MNMKVLARKRPLSWHPGTIVEIITKGKNNKEKALLVSTKQIVKFHICLQLDSYSSIKDVLFCVVGNVG